MDTEENCLVLAVLGLGSLLLFVLSLLGALVLVQEELGTDGKTGSSCKGGAISSRLLLLQGLDAVLVSRDDMGLTADFSRGVVTLGLAFGDDNNGQEDLTPLLATDGGEVETTTDGVSLGGEDLVEGDGGEGNGLISGGLLIDDLDVEVFMQLGVEVLEGEGLVPGGLLAGVLDGLGLLEVLAVGDVQGNASIGVVLAEALNILQMGGLVNGDLERVGHGWL
jgi:hypothetical protein